jgi:hypothetical protein
MTDSPRATRLPVLPTDLEGVQALRVALDLCRRAWARVTIDQFRRLALQTFWGHRASNIFSAQF